MRILLPAVAAFALASSAVAQNYTIQTFAGGVLPENIPGASASLGNVSGVAVDTAGNTLLSLSDYNIVVRLDAVTGLLTRVAGNGTRGFGGDSGPAAQAELSGPAGIAVDKAGNLYIADAGNARIRMVANGVISTVAGNGTRGSGGDQGPATSAQFNGAIDIAVDQAGNLYVADFYNQAVRKIANGIITTVAGNGGIGYSGDNGPAAQAQLGGPSGLTVDAAGNLYIAEAYNNSVRRVSNGVITTVAGVGIAGFTGDGSSAARATLRQPIGLTVSAAGDLYIVDAGNNRIRKVAASGGITTVAGNGTANCTGDNGSAANAGLGAPQRIGVDASGNLYFTDSGRVRKIARSLVTTMISTVAGGGSLAGENGPALNAQLVSPQGVALDSAGSVYISDLSAGRVLKVSGGTLSRVAAVAAPSGIATDAAGALYVADSQNGRVSRLSDGGLTTVAGGGTAFGDDGPATRALLASPQSIAVDSAGKIYVVDLDRVRAVSKGSITTVAGNGGDGYQGDNGPATAAMLSSPTGVAVNATGDFFIADTVNNRVRMVSNGVITTVAGNGVNDFTYNATATSAAVGMPAGVTVDGNGDLYITDARRILKVSKGKLTTIGGLAGGQGIAVDENGKVYVADPASHRVSVLTPAGASCGVTATAPATAAAAGGPEAITVKTGPACTWAVESLPNWISVAGDPFGAGSASVPLVLAPNVDAPRTATVVVGGQNVVVAQAGTMTIVGQVTRAGSPLPGVTVTLSGGQSATAITDSGGNFTFSGLNSAASYVVTPALAGNSFAPASQTFANVTSNPTATFVAFLPPEVQSIGPAFAGTLQPAPKNLAAGEIVTVMGVNLCGDPASAVPTLPDRLSNCIVQVDGANIHLYYASPVQINAVLPQSLALGTHQMVIQRYSDSTYKTIAAQSQSAGFTVDRVAMSFVERTEGTAHLLLVQYQDGGLAGAARPLHAGDTITLYLTGLGKKAQTFAEGAAPKATSAAAEPIQIQVQGLPAQISYAGVQSQYPGFDQITIVLPKYTLPAGKSTATIQIAAPSAGQTLQYEINAN